MMVKLNKPDDVPRVLRKTPLFEVGGESGITNRPLTERIYGDRTGFGHSVSGTGRMAITTGMDYIGRSASISTATALDAALATLDAHGFSRENVVKARVFLEKMESFGEFNGAYAKAFGGHAPARECVQADRLSGNGDVQISLIASKEPIRVVLSPNAPSPIGPYSQAIMAGSRLYASGQIADASLPIEEQAKRVLNQLKEVLASGSLTLEDVLKATIYVQNLEHFRTINEIYGGVFRERPPARETVQMRALPKGVGIEISVIAEKNAGREKWIIAPEGVPAPVGPYSHAVEMGDTIFLSGQICREGNFGAQMGSILNNIGKILDAAGAEPRNVVAATVFLQDLGNLRFCRNIPDFFSGGHPVIEVVQPAKLPFGVDIEISCIAVK